ncbi:MAG TPA: phosphoadenylyl-sulfate reductase [Acidobacteriota bacterium]|jgi:phosphoadenosine phosphosulfate reductase|nr:phosphoadenylyl-sulfate reductase [Acidobacteriota bacterium]
MYNTSISKDTSNRLPVISLQQRINDLELCLQETLNQFHPKLALACSFGAEDMVLVDALGRLKPSAKVFYLDTSLLFDETYQLIELARDKYSLYFERVTTDLTLQSQEKVHGPALWMRFPDQCCQIRKVEPLKRYLSTLDAWITGIRREQSATRAHSQIKEWDSKFALTKFNPLAFWTWKDVWSYICQFQVPYNPLHDQNYPSIGCIPCTAPILPGEDPRSGRWKGSAKTECGLHK